MKYFKENRKSANKYIRMLLHNRTHTIAHVCKGRVPQLGQIISKYDFVRIFLLQCKEILAEVSCYFFKNSEFSSEQLSTRGTKSLLDSFTILQECLLNSCRSLLQSTLKYMQSVLFIQLNFNFSDQNFVFKNSSLLSPIARLN